MKSARSSFQVAKNPRRFTCAQVVRFNSFVFSDVLCMFEYFLQLHSPINVPHYCTPTPNKTILLTKNEPLCDTTYTGWGIGTPIDMQDEEFSRGSSARRRRRKSNSSKGNQSDLLSEVAYGTESVERATNKFNLDDPVEFTQRVRRERDTLKEQKKNDLLEIAKIAGLGDRLKPKVNSNQEGYGKFDDDVFDVVDDDDESLDVRVY